LPEITLADIKDIDPKLQQFAISIALSPDSKSITGSAVCASALAVINKPATIDNNTFFILISFYCFNF
jgi:hypothetical protein